MKKLLQAKFLPVNHRQDAYLDYNNLKQQSLSVEEFITEFDKLRMRCGADEEDEQVIARFLGGLRTEISDVVHLQPYWTLNDVYKLAHQVEKQLKAKPKTTPTRFSSTNRVPTASTTTNTPGPIKAEASSSPTPPVVPSPPVNKCFKCHGFGHLKRECPTKQMVTFVDETDPVYDTEDEVTYEDGMTEVIYPDKGEALISQRVLSASVAKTEDGDNLWLRNNIFRTKCTSKGKICTIIVDGGSCENRLLQ
ncbi:putative transcription factor interactor and regulator CCHC(Zn) family [Helianthus annuus]|nr:putative transcription factor interactor and regulator CCHC(Zn) family [Helianthus annuus]